MKAIFFTAMLAVGFVGTLASAGPRSAHVKVHSGHFCANNYCMRFSKDLQFVSIQGRREVSVASYGLRRNPVVSSDEFRQIFKLALRQRGINGYSG